MRWHERFNQSDLSRFINSPEGRVLRVVSGLGFLAAGAVYRHHALGVAAMVWGLFPLSAGALDICYASAVLGGPLRGAVIRARAGTKRPSGARDTRTT